MYLLLLLVAVVAFVAANNAPYKGYSGTRLRNDSLMMIYYYEQAFAVVELGRKRELYNCEIIEAYETSVQKELLRNLTAIGKAYKIGFKSMLDLMNRCDELHPLIPAGHSYANSNHPFADATGSLFNGVLPDFRRTGRLNQLLKDLTNLCSSNPIPSLPIFILNVFIGTRWCGNGDIASSYYDLGSERSDRCCRKHDLCPIKVRNTGTKYGITNKGFSMSHCDCDYEFQKCLKSSNSSVGGAMEYLYFEVLQSMCLEGSLTRGFKIKSSAAYTSAKGIK